MKQKPSKVENSGKSLVWKVIDSRCFRSCTHSGLLHQTPSGYHNEKRSHQTTSNNEEVTWSNLYITTLGRFIVYVQILAIWRIIDSNAMARIDSRWLLCYITQNDRAYWIQDEGLVSWYSKSVAMQTVLWSRKHTRVKMPQVWGVK